MRKIKFFVKNLLVVSALMCGLMLTNCGGGSGSNSSSKKLVSNDVLGDLPDLVYQHAYADSVFYADRSEAEQKAKIEEFKAKQSAEYKKLAPSIVGNNVPVEVEEGLGYEITSCKIVAMEYSKTIVEYQLKVTDNKAIKTTRAGQIVVAWQNIDKDGKQIGDNAANYSELKDGEANDKIFLIVNSYNVEQWANFDKIKFVKW